MVVAALVIVGLAITITTAAVLNSSQNLHTGGNVTPQTTPTPAGGGGGGGGTGVQTSVDIGVYSDSACTQTATSLNWGSLEPGDQATRTVYVKNNGNTAVSLSVSTTGWSPLNAQQWMTVFWNRQGETLQPNQSIQATITLTVSSSIDSGISNFNFDVTITGTA